MTVQRECRETSLQEVAVPGESFVTRFPLPVAFT